MKLFFRVLFHEFYHLIATKNSREFLRLLWKYGDKPRYKSFNINTSGLTLKVPDALSFVWQFKEIFADENYRFHTEKKDPLIYDCGANIGTSVLYFKKIFPKARIKAFEADPEISEILSNNLTINKINDVEVINAAIWKDNLGIEMNFDGADAGSVFTEGDKKIVKSIRLKELVEQENEIDLLKIDIEGAEYEVMRDCGKSLQNIKNIFVECHSFVDHQQEVSDILKVLEENNFRYFIKPEQDRNQPFVNKTNKNFPNIDLQLNIYAYKKQ